MQINNIQNTSKNEVVVVNRKINFQAGKTRSVKLLPQEVIKKYGLNMRTRIGYTGPDKYVKAPDGLPDGKTEIFRSMDINWATHVDKNAKKSFLANANIYIG